MSDDPIDSALLDSLEPLTTMPANLCVPLAPRRIPLQDGQECLVQWRAGSNSDHWALSLTKRPVSVDETDVVPLTFQTAIDLQSGTASASWSGQEPSFREWVTANLARIAAETRKLQEQNRPALLARAQVSAKAFSVKEYVPHAVILLALAAFVYMFAIVHIK